jgi:hypothetical protein
MRDWHRPFLGRMQLPPTLSALADQGALPAIMVLPAGLCHDNLID